MSWIQLCNPISHDFSNQAALFEKSVRKGSGMLVWLVMFLAATAAVSADAPSEVPKEGFYLSIEGIKPQEVVPLL